MRRERSLAWFAAAAAASATYLVLGLTTEQRICLYSECFNIAKEDSDRKLLGFCASCLASLYKVHHFGDKMADMNVNLFFGEAHFNRQEYDEAISYYKKILENAKETGHELFEMGAYKLIGKAHLHKKEYDESIFYDKKCFVMAQNFGNKKIETEACIRLGAAHLKKGEYDDAIVYIKKGFVMAQECGDKKAEMNACISLGLAHSKKKEYDDALFYFQKFLAMARQSGNKRHEIIAYIEIGDVHSKKQEYDTAVSYGLKCLHVAQECGDKDGEMKAYLLFGNVYLNKPEYDDAISYGKKFLHIAQECGDKDAEMQAYILLGNAYLNKQEYDDAILYCEKCLPIAQECGDKETEMTAYKFLSDAHLRKDDDDDAIFYSRKCLAIAQESGSKEDEMRAYTKLGHALLRKQEDEDMILYGEKWLSLAQECGDTKAEMAACSILCNAHLHKEEYDDYISYERKFLTIAQDSGDEKKFMADTYISLGTVYFTKGEYQDAIAYSKRVLTLILECGDKALESDAYKLLGHAHYERKEYDDAMFYTKKFLAMTQQSGDKKGEIFAYIELGNIHLEKQEYDDAISCGEKCLSIAQKCGDKEAEMKAYTWLGNAFKFKEEYDEATSYFGKCLNIAQQSTDKVAEMETYLLMGKTHLTKEEYEEAIHCGTKCLAMAQEAGDKEKEMDAYELLGTAHWKNNAYDDAHSFFTEGKKIAMDLQDDSRRSAFESYLSMTYEEVGIEISNELDADILHAIRFKRFNKHGDEIKWIFSYLDYVRHKGKREYDEGISSLEEAEATLPTTQPRNDSIQCRKKRWICKHGMSDMHVKLGQHDEAMKYQQEALDVAVTNSQKATSHFSLGKLYCQRQKLENAKQSLEESLKCYELIFKDLKQNDRFKIAFVDKYKEVYKMLLKVLFKTNKKEEALVLSDRYRAKALKDLLVSSYEMKKDPTAEEAGYLQYADVQSLVSCTDYSLLFYSACDEKLCTFLVQAGNDLEFSLQHFEYCEKCLDQLVDKAFEDMKVRQVVDCEDRSLDVVDDSEENKNPKEDELSRLLTRQIEERLTEQRSSICGCRGEPSENTDDSSLTSGLEILYNKLIHNIKCLVKQDEIVIIPEGPLCKVPFAALLDPDKGQYLSETKRIRIAPSISTLKILQEYPEEHQSSKQALIIGAAIIGLVKLNGIEKEIPTLPGVIDEAIDIGRILGVRPLLGAKATKATVINRLQEGASIVHIAAHGSLEKTSIVLAPPEIGAAKIPDEEDYMLTMADVQQAQVRAQLVVLSCCHTGRGEIKAEGVVGMCRAFLASGARAVMGSLWAVDDKATRTFMETFYSHLKDGKSASTSLHLTMNDIRSTPEYSEPKYWTSYSCFRRNARV